MTDRVIQNLLLLYAGLLLVNSALTAVLWAKNRSPLFRALFFVWLSTLLSFLVQGTLQHGSLAIAIAFVSVFPVNLSLAFVLGHSTETRVNWRPFAATLLGGVVLAVSLSRLQAPFWMMALPVCVAVSLPTAVTGARVIRSRWRSLTVSGKTLALSSLAFAAHNLDYAFLRDKPSFAPLGFTIAILIIFALSITGPAVALEIVAEQRARIAAEFDAARRIQRMILPREIELPGFEVVGYVRATDSVGGDYFDAYRSGEDSWLLLGDVTGHGLGAGLVMLMAQSTLSAIVRARPDVSPRELNHIANRVLCDNLARLDERRHMTIVTIRCRGGNLLVSGSHDDLYVWRARSNSVETLEVAHFPWGLGFSDFSSTDVREDTLRLERGDVLFVATDGIVEAARNGDPRQGLFGEGAIRDVLSAHAKAPLETLKGELLRRLDAFTGGIYRDDVAFLVVRATGETS